MRDIRLALRAYLLADGDVTSAVGIRVFPVRLPQGITQPSVVYNRISGNSDYHSQGSSGLVVTRMQIDAWAKTTDEAARVADIVKDRIDGLRGEVSFGSESPQESIEVRGVFHESEREDYDAEANMYRMSRDFTVWYAER